MIIAVRDHYRVRFTAHREGIQIRTDYLDRRTGVWRELPGPVGWVKTQDGLVAALLRDRDEPPVVAALLASWARVLELRRPPVEVIVEASAVVTLLDPAVPS